MFQKMTDEEIEFRTRDAEMRRQQMVTGREEQPPAEESFHPTTDKEFKQRYGGSLYQEENYNPATTGPTNTKIKKKTYTGSKRRRGKVGILHNNQETEENENKSFLQNTNNTSFRNSNNKEGGKIKAMTKKTLDTYGKTMGRGLIATAYAWTSFIYFTFQIWLGIIAVIAIAIVLAIEKFVGDGILRDAFDALMSAIGVDWDFYLVAFLCYLVVVVVCYIQLFGVAIQAKAMLLHPLGGRGASFKTGSFLFCFILYWIPIINCFPLVNLYIFSIQLHPR